MAVLSSGAGHSRRVLGLPTGSQSKTAPRDSSSDLVLRALRFTSAILWVSLLLQRFAVPLQSKSFSLVGPLGLAIGFFALAKGTLAFHRIRLSLFLVLASAAMVGLMWQAVNPAGDFAGGPNLPSLIQFLMLTSFAVLTFAEPVDEKSFFRKVNFWFAVVAVAGVLQFVAQFVGIKIFAFTGILPEALLFEQGYHLQIGVGVGDMLKSNGFFLVEPSVLSQIMALGLIIEMLAFRRPRYLCLFTAALLLSFSGTGWIVIGSFIITAAIGMGKRGLLLATAIVVLLGVVFGAASLLAPDVVAPFEDRIGEISRPGSSGHDRFITPFWVLSDVLKEQPSAALTGLGTGVAERLNKSYEFAMNTPVKIAVDQGFPALLAYLLLFVVGRKSPVQASLTVPACVTFFLAGSYEEFPPMIFLVLLLTSVARLSAVKADAGARARRPAATAAS